MQTVVSSLTVTPRLTAATAAELLANPAMKQSAYVASRVASGASKALARAEFQKAVLAKSEMVNSHASNVLATQGAKKIRLDKAGNPIGITLNRVGSREQKLSELAKALTHAEKLSAELTEAKAMLAKLAAQPA